MALCLSVSCCREINRLACGGYGHVLRKSNSLVRSASRRASSAPVRRTPWDARIGLTVKREGNKIVGGHYFYQRYLRDIPITGATENSHITLAESGGGTFHLHFVGNGSEKGQPLDFDNSVGVEGTWTDTTGQKTYPVSLRGTTIGDSTDEGHRYRDVTNESDEAFEGRVQSLIRAVLRNDKAIVAQLIQLPAAGQRPGAAA